MGLTSYYINLLKDHITINYEPFRELDFDNNIIAFFSKDSLALLCLLDDLSKMSIKQEIVVLVDDHYHNKAFIRILKKQNIKTYNIDRYKNSKRRYEEIVKVARKSLLAICLDGPSGPKLVPKKVLFYLSNSVQKSITLAQVHYIKKIKLRFRWDDLVVPLILPNAEININFTNIGVTDHQFINNFVYNREAFQKVISKKDQNNW